MFFSCFVVRNCSSDVRVRGKVKTPELKQNIKKGIKMLSDIYNNRFSYNTTQISLFDFRIFSWS